MQEDKIVKINKAYEDTILFTVYDILSERYGPVFEATNEAVATRQFKNMLNDIPEDNRNDYQLVRLGLFSRSECKIIPWTEGNIFMVNKGVENG